MAGSFGPKTKHPTRPTKEKAPTEEIGRPSFIGIGAWGGLMEWGQFIDTREFAPALQWPSSVESFLRMQTTDAQIKGLLMATMLPIRRFRWELSENGARQEVLDHVSQSLGLPVQGQEPAPTRKRGRFSWDRHLMHALRALPYGHFYFEQVYNYASKEEGGDGLLHLEKMGTRPPRTIMQILIDEYGDLAGIRQNVAVQGEGYYISKVLEANRLVPYIWDSQDDGDWIGVSILRSCYRNWLVKDRLIRVDATKHERNAMGQPWFEVGPDATKEQVEELGKIAEQMRTGERSGGAGIGKLSFKGVEGSLPDTIASIRYHDQQMSRAFLLMFMDLGTTQTGSRALGGDFIDWYADSQDTIAGWIAETTQREMIENEVELNWGPDEQPPLLTYQRMEAAEMSIQDLAIAVQVGLIALDDEMRYYVMRRFQLPKGAAKSLEEFPPPGQGEHIDFPTAPAEPSDTVRERESQKPAARKSPRQEMADRIAGVFSKAGDEDRAKTWSQIAEAIGVDAKNGTGRRARDDMLDSGLLKRNGDKLGMASNAELKLPDRELRRQPTKAEIAAKVDFASMDAHFDTERESLVAVYKTAQKAQIEALGSAVEAAKGNVKKLAALKVDPVSIDTLMPLLEKGAAAGYASAQQEHADQVGAQPPKAAGADNSKREGRLKEIATAATLTLAGMLAGSASRRAVAVAKLPPAEAASKVTATLNGLSDARLETELGGAGTHAFGEGRLEYMQANQGGTHYIYSGILDDRICSECEADEGDEYQTLEEAEAVCPAGAGNPECEGGLRCRCAIIATYGG